MQATSGFGLQKNIPWQNICQGILYGRKEVLEMEEIQRMQDNLLLIRRTVGWTAEEFGDQIGVTRQTITNWQKLSISQWEVF